MVQRSKHFREVLPYKVYLFFRNWISDKLSHHLGSMGLMVPVGLSAFLYRKQQPKSIFSTESTWPLLCHYKYRKSISKLGLAWGPEIPVWSPEKDRSWEFKPSHHVEKVKWIIIPRLWPFLIQMRDRMKDTTGKAHASYNTFISYCEISL